MTKPGSPPRSRLPWSYRAWLAGALTSSLGDTVLYFALGWAATAHGGRIAGLVLTMITGPRVALLLLGGAAGDRFGARRIMIAGDAAMLAVTAALAVMAAMAGTPVWLLLGAGLITGCVDAFYLPASGSMPRRLVGPALLLRALALRQTGSQVMTLAGGPLGGLLVATAGLAGASTLDAVTFGAVLAVLIVIRERVENEPGEPDGDSARPGSSAPRPARRTRPAPRALLSEAVDGLRVTAANPVLRPALVLTSATAAFLLPTGSLLIPLLARSHHWAADAAGLVVGGQSLGIIAVTMCVVRWGRFQRAGLVAAVSLFAVASGTAALALAPTPALAVVAGMGIGGGSGLLTTHLSQILLSGAPSAYLSRVQSLVSLVQSLPLLVMNNVLGDLAQAAGPAACLMVSAGALTVTGLFGLSSNALRHANPKQDPQA